MECGLNRKIREGYEELLIELLGGRLNLNLIAIAGLGIWVYGYLSYCGRGEFKVECLTSHPGVSRSDKLNSQKK